MKKSNIRRIQRTNKGQWTITVPAVIADAMGLEIGETMEWIMEGNELILKRCGE